MFSPCLLVAAPHSLYFSLPLLSISNKPCARFRNHSPLDLDRTPLLARGWSFAPSDRGRRRLLRFARLFFSRKITPFFLFLFHWADCLDSDLAQRCLGCLIQLICCVLWGSPFWFFNGMQLGPSGCF